MKYLNNKNRILLIIGVIILFAISMIIITFKINADEFANKVTIDKSEITDIITGTPPFDTNEEDGNDISSSDRKVRSFDKIHYNVEFSIKPKEDANVTDLEDRIVNIIVTLTDEDLKYVNFASDEDNITISENKKTAIYSVKDVNTYGTFTQMITLNVNNAPNGYEIKPTFSIKESTDEEEAMELKQNKDIINYMPTIVSSKSNVDIFVIPSNDTQIGSLNDENGRYITFGIGLKLNGDNVNKGIKGLQLPKGDITFDVKLSSSNGQAILNENYIRMYTDKKIDDINPVKLNLPYTDNGNIKITKKDNSTYTITISDYELNNSVTNADGSIIDNNSKVFMTLALTTFSKRTTQDDKNNITISLIANENNAYIAKTQNDENLKEITLSNNSASIINEYREESDYKLTGTFIDNETYKSISNQVDEERHYGSTTKGSLIAFESNFNFKNNALKTGISQIIKIDSRAYELAKINDENYELTLNCKNDKCKLSKDDFEVKYLTGEFIPENYEVVNYSDETMDKTLLNEDINTIQNQCLLVKNNYDNLTNDQIMNLYGGPCLKAKEGVEEEFTNVSDTTGKKITKIILETKDGITLDSEINIDFIVGLRVRNIPDITNTYQSSTLVKSKNIDNTIYFAPAITNDSSSAANYNNYIKTTYQGTTAHIDNKPYADSLKIVNYTARNTINITNKKSDGTKKTSYISSDNETLNYKVDININDLSESVGADDVWYIKELNVTIVLSKYLEFKQNSDYMIPKSIINNYDGTTTLIYSLPYTKTNREIEPILFDAVFKSDIKGSNNEVIVTSKVDAVNVNDEIDTSTIGSTTSKEIIYVTGVNGIVITEDVGNLGSVIEKNSKFNYNLNVYNNSDDNITNLSLMDILPYNNDELGSSFSGTYKVKVNLPNELINSKVYCYTGDPSKLSKDVDSTLNVWESCNITNDYVDATAIKFEEININANTNLSPIVIEIKSENNNYGDKYNNRFYAKSETLTQTLSSIAKVRVVNRTISGQVFIDLNENGIKDDNSYLKNVPVSLCKLDSYNNCKNIEDTKTNENGEYKFSKLDVGRYKVNFIYDSKVYDVTNRYFGSNEAIDSDAYKVSDESGQAEISGRENGLKVTKDIEEIKNMDMGLISKKSFEVDIKKGINKVEINQNGLRDTYNYNFMKTVSLSYRNVTNLTGKVTYGFEVVNTSNLAGYVNMIEENIPDGMSFNPNYEENKDWFSVEGKVYYDALKDVRLDPGERITFEIALDIISDNVAKVFLNEVSIVEITPYEEEEIIRPEDEYVINNFEIGSSIEYAGVNWHVIDDDGENVTLLADSSEISTKMAHLDNSKDVYKWSNSIINNYINDTWLKTKTSLDTSVLIEESICDDASGLQEASYGGTLQKEGTCQSGIYNNYKVRLLTKNEFDLLVSKLTDVSFLIGTNPWWLMNSNYVEHETDEFGNILNDVSNTAYRINNSTNANVTSATNKLDVRPVIKVSKSNIIGN